VKEKSITSIGCAGLVFLCGCFGNVVCGGKIAGERFHQYGFLTPEYPKQIPFDSARWRSAKYGYEGRYAMVESLIKEVRVVGKSRTEIVNLLGPCPDESFTDEVCNYSLAPDGLDTRWLGLKFQDNRVVDYSFWTD
jgi:hypothetical protein